MTHILIKNGRVWDGERFCLTDKAGNTLEASQGYRCKLTAANDVVVYRD